MPVTMTTLTCKHCRQPFAARLTVVRGRGRTYCSPECSALGRTRPISDRLNDLSIYEPNSGCRLYLGVLDHGGYGLMTNSGKTEMAHRAAYRDAVGFLDASLELDHLCRNRACINEQHLEPVPHQTNCARGMSPAAIVVRTQMCTNGHPRTNDNVYTIRNGRKRCRSCQQEASIRYRRRMASRR